MKHLARFFVYSNVNDLKQMNMEIKQNYFLVNAIDLEKNVENYLVDSKYNYVIIIDNEPLVWGNRTPVVYGGMEDVEQYLDTITEGVVEVITEWDFICKYCKDALEKWFIDFTKKKGENDGNCIIYFLDNLNNVIHIDNMFTDILNMSIGEDGLLSFLISTDDDRVQTFCNLFDFDSKTIWTIINSLVR